MFPFNSTSESSLLERRQISQPFLHQLELPSLPPLSQIMTDTTTSGQEKKAQVEAVAVTMAAMEAAATASMITSTAQPLMQTDTPFLPNLTTNNTSNSTYNTTDTPVNTILPIYSNNTTDPSLFMDPLQQQQQMFNAAAAVAAAAGLNDHHHPLLSMPPSFMDSRRPQRESSVSSTSSDNKVYSFVAIPGTNQRKRPRRRYDEIERLYHCSWTGCTKAYGTLNHLNAHVSMQQHVSNEMMKNNNNNKRLIINCL